MLSSNISWTFEWFSVHCFFLVLFFNAVLKKKAHVTLWFGVETPLVWFCSDLVDLLGQVLDTVDLLLKSMNKDEHNS